MDENFSIINKTKNKIPKIDFQSIKNTILGKKYSLSLVFIGDKKSKNLNNSYRNKNKPTNCLSFSLDKNSGEIFINPSKAKKEAVNFSKSFENFITYLFIHSSLHLKGMEHGSTMEKAEERFFKKFENKK